MSKFSITCNMILKTLQLPFNPYRGIFRTTASPSFHFWIPTAGGFHHYPLSSSITQVPHCGCYIRKDNFANGSATFTPAVTVRHYSTTPGSEQPPSGPKPSLYQRFKAMYRDYWYILLPVHCVTSAAWFGTFYYMASSGVDIVAILESLNVSERVINPLRNGHATTGYLAISYALYKIATPLRYTVTLGGSTISINYLKKRGYIKPVPSKEELKEMYNDKKEIIKEKGQSLKDNVIQKLSPTAANTITTKESGRHINE